MGAAPTTLTWRSKYPGEGPPEDQRRAGSRGPGNETVSGSLLPAPSTHPTLLAAPLVTPVPRDTHSIPTLRMTKKPDLGVGGVEGWGVGESGLLDLGCR